MPTLLGGTSSGATLLGCPSNAPWSLKRECP
jgi:hypothetical protein